MIIAQLQAPLRLAEDVIEIVFQGNLHEDTLPPARRESKLCNRAAGAADLAECVPPRADSAGLP
ncbi:MAG: hypothetical protein DME25_11575 [Verrucomicrobia bacterium]|nr:MAG: hypothetical protein DME25_11575 [Verrucomicrobiota bacterium]